MWPRALTAANREEVAHHQDMLCAAWNDRRQLWNMGLFASIHLARAPEMLSALPVLWKAFSGTLAAAFWGCF